MSATNAQMLAGERFSSGGKNTTTAKQTFSQREILTAKAILGMNSLKINVTVYMYTNKWPFTQRLKTHIFENTD